MSVAQKFYKNSSYSWEIIRLRSTWWKVQSGETEETHRV